MLGGSRGWVNGMRIAVDVMGADRGPESVAVGALSEADEKTELILVGDEKVIMPCLHKNRSKDKVSVRHASQVIGMGEPPLQAVRRKSDSSLVTAFRLLGEGQVDAVVTPGNTGAALTAAALYVGRLPSIDRPALAAVFPNTTGRFVLIDVGANVDCKPQHLFQFALMGTAYAERVLHIKNPKVGLLNIGEEPIKGNETARTAHALLSQSQLNFVGNVEGREIFGGGVDVVVMDGFVGNVLVKTAEGCGAFFWGELRKVIKGSWITRAAVRLFFGRCLKQFAKRLDWREYGGAALLGVNGVCIIAHGASDEKAIAQSVRVAKENFAESAIEGIREALSKFPMWDGLAIGR